MKPPAEIDVVASERPARTTAWPSRLLSLASGVAVFASLVGFGWFVYRYDVETLPAAESSRLAPFVEPGANVVLVDVGDETPLGVGSLIEIETGGADEASRRFTRIAACEGATIAIVPGAKGGFDLKIDGKATEVFGYRDDSAPGLAGPIPANRFLAVDPNPKEASGYVRLVDRSAIKRKIVFAGWGR